MPDYTSMTRAELISLMRELEAIQSRGSDPAGAQPGKFPIFGERQRREFDAGPCPMRIFDRETLRYVAVNEAACRLYGYSRDEFLSLTVKDTRHREEHDDLFATLSEPTWYLRHWGPRRHVKKSGDVFIAEIVTQDILFNGGEARLSLTIDVTERSRVQELLRKREREFEALVENAPDIIMRFDRQLRHLYVNRAGSAATGIGSRGFIGKTGRELGMTPDLVRLWEQSLGEVFESKGERTIEFGCRKPEGLRHYESRIVPETGLDGRVETALVISRDITARKRAEVALRESSEFLQRMIESSRDCIKVLDLEGRLLWISAGGQRLMEIDDASSLLGKSYLDFWSGSDRDAAHNALVAALAGGVSRFEAYCPTTKRVPKWWDELVTPMLGNDGRPEKLLVVSRDITERRHTESALRESEERFRQLAENIRQVFWINTRSGDQTIYVSPAYEEIWGRSRDSLYRNPREWMRSIHTEDLPVVEDGMKKQARGENLDLEYRIIRPDGSVRWISDRSYHMKSGDGTLLACGIAEDITDRKLAEQERLNHAMQQRDALVREVHHRIKNSLQGIVGLLRQKIRKKPAIAPEIGETIAQLQSVALVYGLQETRSDGLLSLADVTEAICSSAESLIGGRVERAFERKLLRPACLAGAEAVSVAVALNELVFNALKHQPAAAGKKQARLTLREARDEAEIRISNRGRLPKGFDFARSRSVGSGLALVRTLLAPPGGNVTFNGVRNEVEVVLKLHPPLLAVRQQGAIREM